jgi:hypothetical protein
MVGNGTQLLHDMLFARDRSQRRFREHAWHITIHDPVGFVSQNRHTRHASLCWVRFGAPG